jgi:MFS transporter, DHA1 family, tetracycline resistance protein
MQDSSPKSKSALSAIFLIVVVDILGLAIVLPLLPFYAERYGATPQVVGYLVTIYALCQLLAGPVLGRLSDTMGRKPVLIISQIGTCIGFIILARAHSLALIFLSRFIDGITAGNLPIAQALISDVTEPKDRAKAFGVIGIAFGVGFFIGPGISGYLAQFGFSYPAWAAAGLSLTSILCSARLLPNVRPTHSGGVAAAAFHPRLFWQLLRKPVLGELLLQFLFFGLAFSSFISGFALFAERRFLYQGHPFGAREVGYFYSFIGFLGIFWQGYVLGKIVKRFGEKKLVVAGFLTQAVGYGTMAVLYHIPSLYLWGAVGSFGSGIVRPALTSLVSQQASRAEQGAVMGVNQSLISIAQIVAPILAGFLIGHLWLNEWALATGGFAICGLLLTQWSRVPSPAVLRS